MIPAFSWKCKVSVVSISPFIKYNLDKTFYKESLKLNAHILKFTINSKEYIFKSEIPINFNNFLIKEKLNYNKIKNLLKLF